MILTSAEDADIIVPWPYVQTISLTEGEAAHGDYYRDLADGYYALTVWRGDGTVLFSDVLTNALSDAGITVTRMDAPPTRTEYTAQKTCARVHIPVARLTAGGDTYFGTWAVRISPYPFGTITPTDVYGNIYMHMDTVQWQWGETAGGLLAQLQAISDKLGAYPFGGGFASVAAQLDRIGTDAGDASSNSSDALSVLGTPLVLGNTVSNMLEGLRTSVSTVEGNLGDPVTGGDTVATMIEGLRTSVGTTAGTSLVARLGAPSSGTIASTVQNTLDAIGGTSGPTVKDRIGIPASGTVASGVAGVAADVGDPSGSGTTLYAQLLAVLGLTPTSALSTLLQDVEARIGAYAGTGSGDTADTIKGNLMKLLEVDYATIATDAHDANVAATAVEDRLGVPDTGTVVSGLVAIYGKADTAATQATTAATQSTQANEHAAAAEVAATALGRPVNRLTDVVNNIDSTATVVQNEMQGLLYLAGGRTEYSDDRATLSTFNFETDNLFSTTPLEYVLAGPYKGRLKVRGKIALASPVETWRFTFGGTIQSAGGLATITLGGTQYVGLAVGPDATLDMIATATQQAAASGERPIRIVTCSSLGTGLSADILFDGDTAAHITADADLTAQQVATALTSAFSVSGWEAVALDTLVLLRGTAGVPRAVTCVAGPTTGYVWSVQAPCDGKPPNIVYTTVVAGAIVTVTRALAPGNSASVSAADPSTTVTTFHE